ncbi:hypothetical protein ACFVUH_03195 [Kitasatospora sp. NPDC058032]|uniref:hypothetical protein n=1 Tax=Kitasatospora sp. NPDC058032 TaxID=3346307 RepID=UPI0036DD5F82
MSTSALTGPSAEVRPAHGPGRGPSRGTSRGPSGVLWLAWRQSRVAVRTMVIPALLAALVLITMHVLIQDRVETMRRIGCLETGVWDLTCQVQGGRIGMLSWMFVNIVQPAVTAVPVLLGMFLGGPLLAQEYESGTLRLVLAQSAAPYRWLAARLAVPGAVVLLLSAVLSALTSWVWRSDIVSGAWSFDPPFQGFTYPVLGTVPVAWALFGTALGVLVGQLVRRTVVAVLVSGAAVVLAHAVVLAVRPFFWPLVEEEQGYNNRLGGFAQPANAWLVEHGVVLADGTRLTNAECAISSDVCAAAPTSWGRYHPVSHFVPIQLVETVLLLVLTALVVTSVFRRLTRAGV